LERWENEARADGLSENLIQFVAGRIGDYSRLSPVSRAETIEGVWKRIQRSEGIADALPAVQEAPHQPPQTAVEIEEEEEPAQATPALQITAPPLEIEETRMDESAPTKPPPSQPPQPSTKKEVEPAGLSAPVTVLSGVGPGFAQNLSRLGIVTLHDLLYYFPRRFDDYSRLKPINRLNYGEEVTVIGTVQSISLRKIRSGRDQIVEAVVSDGTGNLRITWFNQIWVAKRLHSGAHIVLSGKIDQYLGRLVMNSPDWEPLEQQQLSTNRIVPVYPLTAQVTQRWLRRTMNQVVTYWAPRLVDPLPDKVRRSANLMDLTTALSQAHFPDSWEDLKAAQQRLAFDEILMLQLGVLRQKFAWQEKSAQVFEVDAHWLDTQIEQLPFTLTEAQQHAVEDIVSDLKSGQAMNRLLQGDVGSGKTIVAALAIAIVAREGAQAAVMAPTSILAEQHYQNMLRILAGVNPVPPINPEYEDSTPAPLLCADEIRLMIGATPESEKAQIRQELENGQVKLLIGTHALIEAPVLFSNLKLIVVDEQHRFGVEQRAALRQKGDNPHLLVMTATPIPRSLALTVYGDLDLTVMDEMPPGRQPVGTYVMMPKDRERAYNLIRNQVKEGRQAFIIYPLVEESEKSEAKAAVEEYTRLQNDYFTHLRLGLLHGRMRPEEKDEVMTAFRNGEMDILISTSVVEVGVDVPNATIMLIEGANRFGLAQLHQFRGRVGRGGEKSYCILIPDSPDAAENERLQVMTETNNGFILAERDLEQRGPGQFLGTRQSGFSELQVANLSDVHLIEKARRHAQAIFADDRDLTQPENQFLKAAMQRAWGKPQGDIS
jgi:ATP-dependent DNA helicase RecG